MAYRDVAEMRSDSHLLSRCAAAAVKEQYPPADPWGWAVGWAWQLAATPGWDSAWEYGRTLREQEQIPDGGVSQYPPLGFDAGVITDADILTRVQQLLGGVSS